MSNFNVAVLISGNGSNLQAIIDKFQKDELVNVCCVVSNKKDAYGLVRAEKAKIDHYFIDNKNFSSREEFEQAIINILNKYEPDLVVLAGFMRILSELFVNKYQNKLINIHPSLLPKYKGLDTHRKVLENQDDYHGVTVHFVDNTLDGGPILAQTRTPVETQDIKELEEKIHELEHKIYPEVIKDIAQKQIYVLNGKVIKENNDE
ncbi:MAG: phosphoribosylglycinamide formyltransferase [Gammaproteobacteria bacterium]|tara:strand:- start:409 stop:1023 length:615 start_codon:yes stop_codon:yes gene_type:complete